MAVSTIQNSRLVTQSFTSASFDLSGNGTNSLSINLSKNGYELLGLTNVDISSNDVGLMKYSTYANTAYIRVKNVYTNPITNITVTVRGLYQPL